METSLNPVPLVDLIEQGGDELNDTLRSFSCTVNESIEDFLHNKAVKQEKEDKARTTVIIDDETGNIVGYFTILIQNFLFTNASNKDKERLSGNKDVTSFNCILIAKIGRSDEYKSGVSGAEILRAAIYNCSIIKSMTATKAVCVEYKNEPNLLQFYKDNEFKLLQQNENGLNISFIKI